jgi:polysaccharide export outer membrane protein
MNKKTNAFPLRALLKLSGLAYIALLAFTGCTTAQMPKSTVQIAPEKNHTEVVSLREGDILKITFPGSTSLDTTQQIRRDGKITLQLVGDVDAAGLTPDELQQKLVQLYASQITTKQITVVLQSSSFPVFVTGSVIHPGKVLSDHPITALEALMEAGGPDYATANLKAVRVSRNNNGVMENFTLNLKAVLQGTDTKTFYLKPGDIVFVPERFAVF